jgi:hypothetical protein
MKLPKFELSMNYFTIHYFISSLCGFIFGAVPAAFEIDVTLKK